MSLKQIITQSLTYMLVGIPFVYWMAPEMVAGVVSGSGGMLCALVFRAWVIGK